MSNQVYAADTHKYYPMPGINNYILVADDTIANGGTYIPITGLTEVSLEQFPGFVTPEPLGLIRFEKEGIYSIHLTVAMQTTNAAVAVDMSAEMRLVGGFSANGAPLDQVQAVFPITGYASSGSTSRMIPLSYVGYMNAGDRVQFKMANNGSVPYTVLKSGTHLTICKIA